MTLSYSLNCCSLLLLCFKALAVLLSTPTSNNLFVHGGKFAVSGPVLTVTLRDPDSTTSDSSIGSFTPEGGVAVDGRPPSSSAKTASKNHKTWLDLTSLRPNLFWSVQSTTPPLPNWLPSWKSLRTNVGYRYDDLKRLPSFVETELKFRNERLQTELTAKPTYEVKSKRSNLLLCASRGSSYILARFTRNHNGASQRKVRDDDIEWDNPPTLSTTTSRTGGLSFVKASYRLNFPSSNSALSSLRITPTFDVLKGEPTCELETITGGSSRSLAILKLNYHNPTLQVVHAIDDRNTISPEIALYNAKIVYSWTHVLGGGSSSTSSSIRTRVDPTSAIEVQWTDTSATDGGRWVTDFRLPLEGTTLQALASEIKIRRQFNF